MSRKARKKRIAENAEMNGENFYSRQNTLKADSPPPMSLQPTAPMVNGAPGADKLPSFATFEVNKNRRPSDEERLPLNSRSPSNRTGPSSDTMLRPGMGDEMMMDRYGGPTRGGPAGIRGGRGGWPYQGPRDEFGNPLPPSPAFGPMPPGSGQREPSIPRMRHEHSNETMNSQGSRGRGRGGYPSRGYGREGPYNGNRGGPAMNGNGRGIPLGAMAVGAGAGIVAGEMMGRGERGPPPGYGNGYSPQGRGGQGQYTRDMSPASYGGPGAYDRRPSPGPPSAPGSYGYDGRQRSPAPQRAQRFQENSPPPELPGHQPEGATGIGQAVEMDATTGSPSQTPQFGPMHNFSESDSDVQGLVGLQQNRVGSPLRHDPSLLTSPTSLYSSQKYVQILPLPRSQLTNYSSYIPPRAAWAGGIARNNTPPLHSNQQLSPVHHSPVELPASQYHTSPQPQDQHSPIHVRNTSADNYYEDVSPRFADSDPMAQTSGVLPSALLPGHNVDAAPIHHQNHQQQQYLQPQHREERSPGGHLQPSNSYESIQEGTRSPAESDNSNFTSVSQRGVNPDWRPAPGQHIGGGGGNGGGPGGMGGNGGYGGMGVGGVPNRRPIQPAMQQQRDLLLASNPDFEVPSMAGGRGGRNGGGGRGGRGGMGGMGLGGYPGGAI